jgi:hypothetical protein
MEPKEQIISTQMHNPQNHLEPSHAEVALLAYTISQSQKGRHRSTEDNWFEAERVIKEQRYAALTQQPPEPKNTKAKSTSAKK